MARLSRGSSRRTSGPSPDAPGGICLARGRPGQTLAGRGWAVTLEALRAGGPNAPLRLLGPGRDEPSLAALATDRGRRRSSVPVGSAAWVELLGYGGAEDTSALG
jgi:hypothetical protein